MRWLIGEFGPVGLFSLKHGEATSTGGKSLLVPTPFALRTGLLDVALRVHGRGNGEEAFEKIRALELALRPPPWVAQSGLFGKILKPERDRTRGRPLQHSIAFREYVQWQGPLALAFGGPEEATDFVAPLLPHLNYLGKRGSFIQLLRPAWTVETEGPEPPSQFVQLTGAPIPEERAAAELTGPFPLGLIQRLDDWGPELTFDKLNVYSPERIRLHRDRVRFDVILPYRVVRGGRGFTVYRREEAPGQLP